MRNRKRREKGVALLVTIVALVGIIGLALGLFYTSMADNQEAIINQAMISAIALAEGATEQGQKELIEAAVDYRTIPTEGTFTVNGFSADYTIEPIGDVITGVALEGAKSVEQQYLVSANAEWNGMHKRVQKIVNVTSVPLFQFAIFYEKDLEILPGPSLTINGSVHTNGDMYLGCGSTLTLDTEYVRAVGKMYRRTKDGNVPTDGIVNIKVWGDNKFEKMETAKGLAPPSVSGFDSDFLGYDANGDGVFSGPKDYPSWTLGSQELWNGTVMSAEHGAMEIAAPTRDSIRFYEPVAPGEGDFIYNPGTGEYLPVAPGTGDYSKGFYHERANVVIIDGVIYQDGMPVVAWPDVDGDGVPDDPISESTFYDAREEKDVTVTNVDLELLAAAGCWPDNGLLYAVRTDATVEQPNGIRLTNGAVLAGPLTVATDNPLYTHGDYNIGDSKTPKMPAAIMTDAFNVLSESWDDTKKPGDKPPGAHPTLMNVCIMTGSHPTEDGSYNGGFENLPRFHETWNGSPAEIRGSFVHAWDSEIARGKWAYGDDRYTALSRDWDYDTALDDPDFLPPFTPKITFLKRVVWVSR